MADRRFSCIPLGFGGRIYAAEFTNGMVKVGFSNNPRIRLQSLGHEARRVYGAQIGRFFVSPNIGNSAALRAEAELIAHVAQIGTVVPGHFEYFTGVDFEQVADLLEAITDTIPVATAQSGIAA